MNSTAVDVETPIFSRDTFASTLAGQSAKRYSRLVHTPLIAQHLEHGALTGTAIEVDATTRLLSLEELDKALATLVKRLAAKDALGQGHREGTPALHPARAREAFDVPREQSPGASLSRRVIPAAQADHTPSTTPTTNTAATAAAAAAAAAAASPDAGPALCGSGVAAEGWPAGSFFVQLPSFFARSGRGELASIAAPTSSYAELGETLGSSSGGHWLASLLPRAAKARPAVTSTAPRVPRATPTPAPSSLPLLSDTHTRLPRVVLAAFGIEGTEEVVPRAGAVPVRRTSGSVSVSGDAGGGGGGGASTGDGSGGGTHVSARPMGPAAGRCVRATAGEVTAGCLAHGSDANGLQGHQPLSEGIPLAGGVDGVRPIIRDHARGEERARLSDSDSSSPEHSPDLVPEAPGAAPRGTAPLHGRRGRPIVPAPHCPHPSAVDEVVLPFCLPDYRDLAGWLTLLVWTRLVVVYLLRELSSVQATAAWSAWYWSWAQEHPRQATVHFALGSVRFWRSAARGDVAGSVALVYHTSSRHMMALRSLFRLIVSCVGAVHNALESLNAVVAAIQRESEAATSDVAAAAAAAMRVAHPMQVRGRAASHPVPAARSQVAVHEVSGTPSTSTAFPNGAPTHYGHYGRTGGRAENDTDPLSPMRCELSRAASMQLPAAPRGLSRQPTTPELSRARTAATVHQGRLRMNGSTQDLAWEVHSGVGSACGSALDGGVDGEYGADCGRPHPPFAAMAPCQSYNAVAALRVAVLTAITRVSAVVSAQALPLAAAQGGREDGGYWADRSAYGGGARGSDLGMAESFEVGGVGGLAAAMEPSPMDPVLSLGSPQLRLGEYQTARGATLAEGALALRVCVARSRLFVASLTNLVHTAHHPPAARHWRRATVALLTVVPAFAWLYAKSPAELARLARAGASRLRQMLLSYVLMPAQQLREAVFYVRPGVEERRTSFDRDARALANIVRDYHEDYFPNRTQADLSKLRDHCLDCLRKGVADQEGFGLIEEHYRSAVKHPVRSALFGDLSRILLIQLSFQALEMSRVTNGMDEVLEGNDLNFKVMACMPVFGLMAMASLWTYVKWSATMAPIRHRMKLIWRAIYRVITLAEGDTDGVRGGALAGIPARAAARVVHVEEGHRQVQARRRRGERDGRGRQAMWSPTAPGFDSSAAADGGVRGRVNGHQRADPLDPANPSDDDDASLTAARPSPGSASQSTGTQRFDDPRDGVRRRRATVTTMPCSSTGSPTGERGSVEAGDTIAGKAVRCGSAPRSRRRPDLRLEGIGGQNQGRRDHDPRRPSAPHARPVDEGVLSPSSNSSGEGSFHSPFHLGAVLDSPAADRDGSVELGVSHLSSVRGLNNYEQGMVLVLVHLMRSLAQEYYRSYAFYHELMEDLDDLESMQSTRHRKMETLRRMAHTHSFLR